jgi:hypothetical protein
MKRHPYHLIKSTSRLSDYMQVRQPKLIFFRKYTIHQRRSQRTHTHPYEYTTPTPTSIFEDCAGKSSRLTKSPQAHRCRRERRLSLKAQTPLNPEKFAPTRSQTQDLRCYRGTCNHQATGPFATNAKLNLNKLSWKKPHKVVSLFFFFFLIQSMLILRGSRNHLFRNK